MMRNSHFQLVALFGLILAIVVVLASCAPKIAIPREGRHLGGVPQQEIEQCRAQPDFPGCANVGR